MSADETFTRRKTAAVEKLRQLERDATEAALLAGFRSAEESLRVRGEERLRGLRAQGYLFLADVAGALAETRRQLESDRPTAQRRAQAAADVVADRTFDFHRRARDLDHDDGSGGDWALDRFERDLDEARAGLDRARPEIDHAVGDLEAKLQALDPRFRIADLTVHHVRGLSVPFAAGESPYLAVAAEWQVTGKAKEDPDGVLVVTDRRILMERREKEGGFLGFGGRSVQGLLWEVPLDQVVHVRPEERGVFGGVDLIHLDFQPGAFADKATVEIKGGIDAPWFADRLKPALAGELGPLKLT